MNLLKTKSYINGQWITGKQKFNVHNPYDGSLVAEVQDLNQEDCKEAINAAHKAFKKWRAYSAGERSQILRRWYDLQMEHAEELAEILTREQGKPWKEALGEIKYGASFVEWFAEEAKRIYGDVIPGHHRDKRITTIKQPVGVVAAITPWNFPNAMITRKVAPALAAGCTVVIKPPHLTPLSALALAELADQAGFPPGVINIICSTRAKEIGQEMCRNPLVRKVSFTGSTAVGKILMRQCVDTVKKVSMELGGNAPFIVFNDADVKLAVQGAIASKYRNAGQTCVCANRIFVQDKVYHDFISQFSKAVSELTIGNGMNHDTDIGPLIEEKAILFVEDVVNDAKTLGANILTGGKRYAGSDSLIYEPTIIADATKQMKVFQEEIFGPIAPIFKFSTEDEVIDLANDTPFGLASYFYGRDYAMIWRVAEALEYGMVGINTGMISTTVAPFGGIKESGFGREGSKYGMDDYVELKYMCWGAVNDSL